MGQTIEDCISIDVLQWHREGNLCRSNRFISEWWKRGAKTASVQVQSNKDQVTLKYRSRSYEGYWSDVIQRVRLAWTACRFGGQRPWFVCPDCERHVGKLYGAGKLFSCRHCYRLTYSTQRMSGHDRDRHRAQRICIRLGGTMNMYDPFPHKPKHMHWRTYARLRAKHDLAAGRSMAHFVRLLARCRSRSPLGGRSNAEPTIGQARRLMSQSS